MVISERHAYVGDVALEPVEEPTQLVLVDNFLGEMPHFQQDLIQYELSPRMIGLLQQFGREGETFHEMLERLHWGEGVTKSSLRKQFGIRHQTLQTYFDQVGLHTKPIQDYFSDPKNRVKRIQGIQSAWDERKEEIVAGIHTPESDRLRGEATRRRYSENPETFLESLKLAREAQERKVAQRVRIAMGDDPGEYLKREYVQKRRTMLDISQSTGIGMDVLRRLMREYSIPRNSRDGQDIASQARYIDTQEAYLNSSNLSKLTVKERYVIEAYLGTDGKARMSLSEIARGWNVSHQWVSYLLDSALGKLKSKSALF